MMPRPGVPAVLAVAWLLACTIVSVRPARAERLPITSYGAAEGLPSTFVVHVTRDPRGFLWFSTRDGLSRFDGVRFVTYGVEHGLPIPTINFLLPTRDGHAWVATNGAGVCRLDRTAPLPLSAARDSRTPLFTCVRVGSTTPANQVNTLHEDRRGRLWIGTDAGLYRIDSPAAPEPRPVPLGLPSSYTEGVHTILEDERGVLWIGLGWGLARITPEGARAHFSIEPTVNGDNVRALLLDRDGRLWIGHQTGIVITRPVEPPRSTLSGPAPTQSLVSVHDARARPLSFDDLVRLPARDGETVRYVTPTSVGIRAIQALLEMPDGHVWIATSRDLIEFDRQRFRAYTNEEGLSDANLTSLTTDAEGHLWAGSSAGGAMKLALDGFRSYDSRDGLRDPGVHAMFEDRHGTVFAVTGFWRLTQLEGDRFRDGQPRLPSEAIPAWMSQVAFLDSTDTWWLLTNQALHRLPAGSSAARVAGRQPDVVGPGLDVWRLYEDRSGDIWIARRGFDQPLLLTWRRATKTLQAWGEAAGAPSVIVTSFTEDAAGHLWIGLFNGDFMRHDAGRFTHFPAPRGPGSMITSLCRDDRGRLWAGSNRDGLIRIDDPAAARPRFTIYSKADGLGSNNVRSVVADRFGRIYAGTARGVDRLDPETRRVQHYTTRDGLLSGFVNAAFRDRTGALWFGSAKGVSRLIPESDERRAPPEVFISGVRAAGTPQMMSHLGQPDVADLTLAPGEGQLQIEFFGLSFGLGESLRYQYRLDGADDRWSDLTSDHTVHYSRLPPRSYTFQVRAVRADGTASARPATVSFRVLPAVWQRAWFQALMLAVVLAAAYAIHRVRVTRLLALERVRARIAGDLHDDLGATLAQIAVLSEVVQTQIDDEHAPLRTPIARIAQTAREAITSMSDIVWAINPQKDSLHELVRRMRRFASEVLPARGITFQLTAPDEELRLGADGRRQLYLIFKEALNNVLRHAECTEVTIAIQVAERRVLLEIADNGVGFTPAAESDGHGLTSMASRARALGGTLRVASGDGRSGTVVTASVPVSRAA